MNYSNPNSSNLSHQVIKFINNYAQYLADCQLDGKLKDEISVWFDTKRYKEISGWKIEKYNQSHFYFRDRFDQFQFKTDSGYGYLRHAAGLLVMFFTEREMEYSLFLGKQEPERIGIFYPATKKNLTGFTFQELAAILRWKISKDAAENWA